MTKPRGTGLQAQESFQELDDGSHPALSFNNAITRALRESVEKGYDILHSVKLADYGQFDSPEDHQRRKDLHSYGSQRPDVTVLLGDRFKIWTEQFGGQQAIIFREKFETNWKKVFKTEEKWELYYQVILERYRNDKTRPTFFDILVRCGENQGTSMIIAERVKNMHEARANERKYIMEGLEGQKAIVMEVRKTKEHYASTYRQLKSDILGLAEKNMEALNDAVRKLNIQFQALTKFDEEMTLSTEEVERATTEYMTSMERDPSILRGVSLPEYVNQKTKEKRLVVTKQINSNPKYIESNHPELSDLHQKIKDTGKFATTVRENILSDLAGQALLKQSDIAFNKAIASFRGWIGPLLYPSVHGIRPGTGASANSSLFQAETHQARPFLVENRVPQIYDLNNENGHQDRGQNI